MIPRQNFAMRKLIPLLAIVALSACGPQGPQEPAIWAAGSSTVFPFASRAAENFARKTDRPAPRVESLGTGGGIKEFCKGVGEGMLDIPGMVKGLQQREPGMIFALEMITRAPLKIPILTKKYWATFDDAYSPLPGRDVARILEIVRTTKLKQALTTSGKGATSRSSG